jgi:hypothetical protein
MTDPGATTTTAEAEPAGLTFVGEPFLGWRMAVGASQAASQAMPPALGVLLREIHDSVVAAHASALDTQVVLQLIGRDTW